MKNAKPLVRLQRLIDIKQRNVKTSQLHLHQQKVELDHQLQRLISYRQEYVKTLMAGNTSPLQMDDTQRFLRKLETSIEDTRVALSNQAQSEAALQAVAVALNSQQKSVARRMAAVANAGADAEEAAPSLKKTAYERK
jgi:flagellar biosynthesis chaperone FliJ